MASYKHEYAHEYKEYLIVWDKKKLLYFVTVQRQMGQVPKILKDVYFNKPTEAIRRIDEYLKVKPAPRKKKTKASLAKEV